MNVIRNTAIILAIALIPALGVSSDQPQVPSTRDDISVLYGHSDSARKSAAGRLLAKGPSVTSSLIPVICERKRPGFERAWPTAARILGELRAESAAPCLVGLLMYDYPPIGSIDLKNDATLINVDPALAALVKIGDPAVPALRRRMPIMGLDVATMGLRVLRLINTPSARDAIGAYIITLQKQISFANDMLPDSAPLAEH